MNWESSEGGRGAQIPEWPPMAVIFNPCTIAGKRALSHLCRRGAWGKRIWRDLPGSQTFHVAKLGLDPGGLDCESVSFGPGSARTLGVLGTGPSNTIPDCSHFRTCKKSCWTSLFTSYYPGLHWPAYHFVSFRCVGNMIRCRWGGCLPCRGNGCLCSPRERCRMGTSTSAIPFFIFQSETGAKEWSQESVPSAGLF